MNDLQVVAWVHVIEGRLVAVRSRGRDLLYLPGGKTEPGEDDRTALSREVEEEVTAKIPAAAFTELGTIRAEAHDQPNHTHVRMTCYTADYRGRLTPAGEVDEIVLLTPAERPRLAPASRAALDLALKNDLLGRTEERTPATEG
ncbi:pyrimidine (deoxy)nucleoside triphosphate pyrophosphohydrolase [Actinomadura rubteroloni]|uniref:Pyrimidine (Deoxy)nucleoside triphosphate pyrophosphohydrolase n=1 Tax=Actinomadura rubteroloni TaxID=1926885 RepID=A0A2P4UHR7_9ACTN|nr:NUDIX domain-containing protein [Actinomadura rubteroloni]POM24602.1 pyrimidine (deoxy)nucleoside triphosphate pyrophosphohydrolase [Actinomadura rubteroloni]